MNLLIIGPEKRTPCIISLIDYSQEKFKKVMYVPLENIRIEYKKDTLEVYYKNINLSNFDTIIPFISKKNTDFGYEVLKILTSKGVYSPISPETYLKTSHELFLPLLFYTKDIKLPDTYISLSKKALEKTLEIEEYPLILKIGNGDKTIFIDSKESSISILDTIESLNQILLLQKIDKGSIIKTLFLFNKYFSSLNNEKYTLDKKEKAYISKIATTLSTKIIYVEFVRTDNDFILKNISLSSIPKELCELYKDSLIKNYITPLLKDEEIFLTRSLKEIISGIKRLYHVKK